eukprot:1490536-Alexandrium_andersonii.AAC.1
MQHIGGSAATGRTVGGVERRRPPAAPEQPTSARPVSDCPGRGRSGPCRLHVLVTVGRLGRRRGKTVARDPEPQADE